MSAKSLEPTEARVLIENLPDVRFAKERFDRPVVEILESSPDTVRLIAQATKTRGYASGLIGRYEVDRRTGRIWRDIDREHEITSLLVETLAGNFLSATPTSNIVRIPSASLLRTIKAAKAAPAYSIKGVVLGKRLNVDDVVNEKTGVQQLSPDSSLGQMLSGFQLLGADLPLVEAYKGADGVIVELYIETGPSSETMRALLGEEFIRAVSSTDPEHWKDLLGPNVLIRQLQLQNITALFADSPARGFSACVYQRILQVSAVAVPEAHPIFLDFYAPNRPPEGENLSDSISRRVVTCLQQRDQLDK